jgi:hypothetical protein
MNADEQIRKLQETKAKLDSISPSARNQELHQLKKEASERIQDHLVDMILHKRDEEIRKKQEKHTTIALTLIAAIVLMSFAAGMFFNAQDSGITGYVTTDVNNIIIGETYTAYTEKLIEQSDVTSLRISGNLTTGSARIYLRTTSGRLLVANLSATTAGQEYILQTDKQEYTLGEDVIATVTPNTGASVYIYHGNESQILVGESYTPQEEGLHSLVAIITTDNDIIRLELNFTVLPNGSVTINTTNQIRHSLESRSSQFEAICDETCAMEPNSRPLLIIEPDSGSEVQINEIIINTQTPNRPPAQATQIPDIIIQRGKAKAIGITPYFIDPDGDEITLEISGLDEVRTAINGNELILQSGRIGSYPARIYATDGKEVTTSNDFYIQVIEPIYDIPGYEPEENVSEEIPMPPAVLNETPETVPEIIAPTTPASTCDGPIGDRPSYCFEGSEEKFFREVAATITDKSETPVGRFTRFGNLVVKGILIENSTALPSANDFKLGYTTTFDFEDIMTYTAWVDVDGNLHLRGRLTQESPVLEPGQFNTYIIKNKLGIVLAYFDELTGDLHLRGNLVQLGKI